MAVNHKAPPPDLRDFWQEFKDIEQSKSLEAEEEETSKTPDEGEVEAAWLQQAGYGHIVHKYQDGKELSEEELKDYTETLPWQHAAAIKKRVDTLNATLKKKKYTTKIDVRNIFPQQATTKIVISSQLEEEEEGDEPLQASRIKRPTSLNTGFNYGQDHLWIKQSPRSPNSPRSPVGSPLGEGLDAGHHRKNGSDKVRHRASFMKRNEYSMTGTTDEVQGNHQQGVETLSVLQKGSFSHAPTNAGAANQLSPVSDTDITFDFQLDDGRQPTSMVDRQNSNGSDKPVSREDSLPNFKLVADKLGITHITDLAPGDIQSIRSLALLEITTVFDNHGIINSGRRSKKRQKDQGIFGVPLSTLQETDQQTHPNVKVPLVFHEIVYYLLKHGLSCEGILRVPGLVTRVKQLRQDLEDKFYQGTFTWPEDLTPNDVATLMKQFLRDLPTPLLTNEHIDAFAQIESIPDKKQQLQALNLLIILLPDVNRDTLLCLLDFLDRVIMHSKENKMILNNVAMIMAPNLFMAPKVQGGAKSRSFELEIQLATGTSNIMKMLIKYHKLLWTVPSALMMLMRNRNEQDQIRRNKDKPKMKFLIKKDKTDVYKKPALKSEGDFQDGVIRVQAPNLTKSSTVIHLEENTTAGDIVDKFKLMQGSQTWDPRRAGKIQSSSQHPYIVNDPRNYIFAGDFTHLFEVGGNIGERCLDHKTNMSALYKVNPNAEWVIKQRLT